MKLMTLILTFALTGLAYANDMDDMAFEDEAPEAGMSMDDYDSSMDMETSPAYGSEEPIEPEDKPAVTETAPAAKKLSATTAKMKDSKKSSEKSKVAKKNKKKRPKKVAKAKSKKVKKKQKSKAKGNNKG